MTAIKIPELDEIYNSVDQRQKILAELGVDYVNLKKQIEIKQRTKEGYEKQLTQYQKVNEIHIEIDILQQSPQGVQQLKERYLRILRQIKAQEKIQELMTA